MTRVSRQTGRGRVPEEHETWSHRLSALVSYHTGIKRRFRPEPCRSGSLLLAPQDGQRVRRVHVRASRLEAVKKDVELLSSRTGRGSGPGELPRLVLPEAGEKATARPRGVLVPARKRSAHRTPTGMIHEFKLVRLVSGLGCPRGRVCAVSEEGSAAAPARTDPVCASQLASL